MDNTIYGLSNYAYHHQKPYSDYLSSSGLKIYSRSPKAAKYALDNPEETKSDALRFGSLFHDLMACMAEHNGNWDAVKYWRFNYAVFEPPLNPKGVPFGKTTKTYSEAYASFEKDNADRVIATQEEIDLAYEMCHSLWGKSGSTSEQVRKLLRWGKSEVSHFVEYKGCKFKFRPDLETKRKIVDWKTVSTDDLSERSINSIIAKFGYDISAAFYLFMEHERTGQWKQFYWVFISKVAPYDAIMVDASKWTYEYDAESDIVYPQVGAIKMKALLDLHIKCTRNGEWPGSEIFIPQSDNGLRIMCPTPPPWEISNAANILEQSYNQ